MMDTCIYSICIQLRDLSGVKNGCKNRACRGILSYEKISRLLCSDIVSFLGQSLSDKGSAGRLWKNINQMSSMWATYTVFR